MRSSSGDNNTGKKSELALVLGYIDQFISDLEGNMSQYDDVLKNAKQNMESAGNFVERAIWGAQLSLLQGFLNTDQQTLARAKEVAEKVRALPPETDLMTAYTTLSNDEALRASFLEGIEAFVVVGDSLMKVAGASAFAWCCSVLLGAEPYSLWHLPERGDPFMTIAQWTAPFVALSLGLVAVGWLGERNVQRLVADPEDSALGWGVVRSSGWKGVSVYALSTTLAAGTVYRGVWLNAAMGAAFASNSRSLDPFLAEPNLRESMGSLVPSVPLPAVVLSAGVVLGLGAMETTARTLSRGASLEVRVQSDDELEDSDTVIGMPSILDMTERVDGQFAEAGRFAIAEEWYDPVKPSAIGLEFLMNTYLAAETVATGSLWASIFTHALSTALCVYACKAGLGSGKPPAGGGSTVKPQPAKEPQSIKQL